MERQMFIIGSSLLIGFMLFAAWLGCYMPSDLSELKTQPVDMSCPIKPTTAGISPCAHL